MCQEEIVKKLRAIFLKRSGIDFSAEELWDEPFFGSLVHMPARELVYVYTDIEKEIGISIPEQQIINNRFNTYRHVLECIQEVVEK